MFRGKVGPFVIFVYLQTDETVGTHIWSELRLEYWTSINNICFYELTLYVLFGCVGHTFLITQCYPQASEVVPRPQWETCLKVLKKEWCAVPFQTRSHVWSMHKMELNVLWLWCVVSPPWYRYLFSHCDWLMWWGIAFKGGTLSSHFSTQPPATINVRYLCFAAKEAIHSGNAISFVINISCCRMNCVNIAVGLQDWVFRLHHERTDFVCALWAVVRSIMCSGECFSLITYCSPILLLLTALKLSHDSLLLKQFNH